jgi:hypothetical protein
VHPPAGAGVQQGGGHLERPALCTQTNSTSGASFGAAPFARAGPGGVLVVSVLPTAGPLLWPAAGPPPTSGR